MESLKYSAYLAIKAELDRIMPEIADLTKLRDSLEGSIEDLCKEIASLQKDIDLAKTEKTKAETILDRQMKENDDTVEELEIGAFRMLDGKYQDDELKSWQTGTTKKSSLLRMLLRRFKLN